MKLPETYKFEVTIHADYNADEWWESLYYLKTNTERRKEVKDEVGRALADRGFYDGDNITIKVLPNKRKRVYCGE